MMMMISAKAAAILWYLGMPLLGSIAFLLFNWLSNPPAGDGSYTFK